ncbi:MAG: hypothetical protein IIA89_12560 [Chloroflexi bacterium]|nr:hypothetical protein [Chloroflexota bacterium]
MMEQRFVADARQQLEESIERLTALEEARSGIEQEIDGTLNFIEILQQLLIHYGEGGKAVEPLPLFPELLSVEPGEFANHTIAEAAEALVRKAQQPLHAKVILNYLMDGGRPIQAKNPMTSLFSVLKRDGRFLNLGKNVWTLKREKTQALTD